MVSIRLLVLKATGKQYREPQQWMVARDSEQRVCGYARTHMNICIRATVYCIEVCRLHEVAGSLETGDTALQNNESRGLILSRNLPSGQWEWQFHPVS